MAAKSFPLAVTIARLAMSPFRCGVEGLDNLPDNGRYIVTANHQSFLDGIVLVLGFAWSTHRPLHMIAYEEPFRHWLLGWFLRSSRCIPFDRGSRDSQFTMMRTAKACLDMGEPVGIFPEAHLRAGPALGRPRPGAALLAMEADVPVVPVGITGTDLILPPKASRPALRRVARLHIGRPIDTHSYSAAYHNSPRRERRRLARALLFDIMKDIADLSGRTPPAMTGHRKR